MISIKVELKDRYKGLEGAEEWRISIEKELNSEMHLSILEESFAKNVTDDIIHRIEKRI